MQFVSYLFVVTLWLAFALLIKLFIILTWRVALDEGVPDVVPDARADGIVLDDVALRVDAAHVDARVAAVVVDARLVL